MTPLKRLCALVTLLALSLVSGCGEDEAGGGDQGASESSSESSPDRDGFIEAIDMSTAILVLGSQPSDAMFLAMGERFCDKWQEAVDVGVGATGPLFVRQALELELTTDEKTILGLVFLPAQEYLCPELLLG